MEEGEVFDSNLLKETLSSLIGTGRRNFAIDLSPMDYIYSDTINVLLALNKRILDVSGRLSLLSPQPEVLQILKRAGIHNILKIFETEADLLRTSEDIILQTSSFKLADIKTLAEEKEPQSEFDALRSEIGSAMTTGAPAQASRPSAPPPVKAPVEAIVHDEEEIAAPQADQAGFGQDFDMGFQEPAAQQPQFTPPPQPRAYGPQQQPFQPRQFTPPPPMAPQPMGPQPGARSFEPAKPPTRRYAPPPPPPQSGVTPEFSARTETRRFGTAPGAPGTPPPAVRKGEAQFDRDLDEFESVIDSKAKKPAIPAPKMERDIDFDDDDLEPKKKSMAPVLILLFLLIVAGGAGVLIGYMKFFKTQPPVATTAKQPAVEQPAVPQLPVETPPAAQTPAMETTPTTTVTTPPSPAPRQEAVPAPVVKEQPATPPPPRKSLREREPVKKVATPAPAPKPAAPAPQKVVSAAPTTKVAGINQVVITSNPSGATVTINGKDMGTTPYTWDTPIYGSVSIAVSKDGYKENSKNVEFTGGNLKEFFSLDKETPPPEPSYTSKPEPAPAPVARTTPAPKPTPVAKPAPEPESDFESMDEPAPEPAPAPSTPVASAGGTGDAATIFIASIPPVADVYLDGKLIGKTNISELKVVSGTHSIRFVKGAKELTKDMTFQPGKNPSQMVRIP